MKKIIKFLLIITIITIQFYIVFLADLPIARSIVSDHIGLNCGKMFQQGVDVFMERKHTYNTVLFGTSMILVALILLSSRKIKN